MSRMSIRTASMLLLSMTASLGCVANQEDASVLILYNKAPGQGCVISPQEDGEIIGSGLIDAQAAYGYVFTPLVKNFARTTEYVNENQRLAFLDGVEVELDLEDGLFSQNEQEELANNNLTRFSVPFSAVVEPDGGTLALNFVLVPRALLVAMANKLTPGYDSTLIEATISLYGSMAGGEIKTQEFKYWVEVCNECIAYDIGLCEGEPQVEYGGGYCNPLQDVGRTDCCTNSDGLLQCPAGSSSSEPSL